MMGKEKIAFELKLGREKILVGTPAGIHLTKDLWSEPRHCNADWEFHLILEGECKVDVEDEHLNLKKNQGVLIAPGQYHRAAAAPGPFEHFTLSFSLGEGPLKKSLTEQNEKSLVWQMDEAYAALAKRVFQERAEEPAFYLEYKETLLSQLIILLFRHLSIRPEQKDSAEEEFSYNITRTIDEYFENHFADQAGEEALAKRLHLSRRQLVRILKDHYGMNFRQKLIRTRMDYAAWLLRTDRRKISQISEAVGYSSEAAFFQVFRRHYGVTPQKYRINHKK